MTRVHLRSKDWLADIKAVAFDGYGTIIDFTEPDFIAAMAEICDQQNLDADAADLWKRFIRASIHFRSENHDRPIYRRYDNAWAIQFERVFKHLRLKADAWAAAMHLKYRSPTPQLSTKSLPSLTPFAPTTASPSSPTPTTTSSPPASPVTASSSTRS